MGVLGGALGGAVNAALGKNTNSLQGFLNKFNNNDQKLVDTIDPLNSFNCIFEFLPCINIKKKTESGFFSSLGKSLVSGVYNALNVGGIMSMIKSGMADKVLDLMEPVKTDHTFLEQLATASLLAESGGVLDAFNFSGSPEVVCPLRIDFDYYILRITIPNIVLQTGEQSTSPFGEFTTNGLFVLTDTKVINMDIINTKLPLLERIFYPWMREVTLPTWSYDLQPYTTATIIVDFSKHVDILYIFTGCRPSNIQGYQPSQELPTNMTRQVLFLFDYMFIGSKKLPTRQSITDTLLGAAGSLGGMLGGMIGGL